VGATSPSRHAAGDRPARAAPAEDDGEPGRQEAVQGFLIAASRLLAVNLDYRETLGRVADLMLSSLADWCIVETADAGGSLTPVAIAHRDPEKAELARRMRRRYPSRADRKDIPVRVFTTGRAELVPEVSDTLLQNIAQSADHLLMLRELAPRSLIVAPLRTRERVLGTIMLANTESARRFGVEDLELAEDLARRAALAIENATLHNSEREARRAAERAAERIGRLQAVTAALSSAVTPAAVADVFVSHGAAAVGAAGGFIRLLTRDGRRLRLEASVGYSKRFRQAYRSLPLASPLPGAEAFRTGDARYFDSAAAVAASPEFAREHEATRHEAIAFVPLHGSGGRIGVMALSFSTPRTFDEAERVLLRTLADQCAQALERAQLFEAERRARAAAELAIEQTTRLQLLAAELAEALTPEQVAEVVVAQGIASVDADAGALQLPSRDGTMLEAVNGQGRDRALIEGEWRRFSPDLKVPSSDAFRTLEPVFIESQKDIRASYPRMLELEAGGYARAGAHIPLVLSGQALGVLFLGFAKPRRFSKSQRSFVLALGRQCAQALRRAQLYEAELEGRSRLGRLIERLHEGVVSVDRGGLVDFASSRARQLLAPAALEEGREVPETWLGFPLRRFVADLVEAEGVVEAQVVGDDGKRVFDLTGIPAARSEAVLLVVTDVSDREQRRRAEREFVDNAAHELRTPLAAITSAIERLQAGAREVPEKRDRFLGHIQNESARLNRLASSLLVLARAQSRDEEPRREEIAIRGLLEELAAGLTVTGDVEVVVECPPDLVARSNRDLLEHALLNLAGNAVRHTDRGRIGLGARALDDGSVTIAVSDTGSGMTPDQLGRLFDRFYRGPGEDGRAGFGLGLPITKDAVEAIGGRIEIESVHGTGTTATIVLPRADVAVTA
jgi:signal transduction histidine kinase/GTP-sensing pleiotropic transcriptional regulator CodY